jgi:hypothetical protein
MPRLGQFSIAPTKFPEAKAALSKARLLGGAREDIQRGVRKLLKGSYYFIYDEIQ